MENLQLTLGLATVVIPYHKQSDADLTKLYEVLTDAVKQAGGTATRTMTVEENL